MRIVSPFPSGKTAIIVTAKGSCLIVANAETFHRVPYEDPWAQGIVAGYVNVPQGELEEGVFTLKSAVVETTTGGNSLVSLAKQADFPHNQYAT